MKISKAESKVMEAFWNADSPLSADEVVAAMADHGGWLAGRSGGTIRTFLIRLLKKKALAASLDGRGIHVVPRLFSKK